jgi:phosphoserine phosphatase RsbU/P
MRGRCVALAQPITTRFEDTPMPDEPATLHLLRATEGAAEPALAEATSWGDAFLAQPGAGDHIVQFYDDEEFLFDAVAHFAGAGLAAGEPVLIVATEPHRIAFAQRLHRNGCRIDDVVASGLLTLLDAHETLLHFMVGNEPDPDRFYSSLGAIIQNSRKGRSQARVRIFGEMVDLLWRGGNRAAAIRLEELWNELARLHSFTLLCAYSMGNFYMPGDGELFDKVCGRHSHVIPGSERIALQSLEHELQQRKELEAALRASLRQRAVSVGAIRERNDQNAERFRLLVESVKDYAIFMLDADGRVSSWNVGAERIKGYRADEIVGEHFSRFYPPETAGRCAEELEIAAREGRFEDEGWRVRKDGSRFWANVVISRMVGGDGKLLGFAKITRDLTHRRALDEERIARAGLEQALAEQKKIEELREQLIGIVGHDLRSPLSSIVMGADLMLKRGMLHDLDAKVTARIARSAERMSKIISQLLDFTRSRLGGGMRVDPRPADLAEICAQVMAEAETAHPDLSLTFETDPDVLGVWDRERLAQVVSNLVGNAIAHGKAGGTVRVVLRNEGEAVTLSVHNEGPAIPAELLPAMFDPFRRQARRTSRNSDGLGLGLFICRELVAAHGGDISVQSTDEAGTTFTVRLPRRA